jgi:hypothetical protein
MNCCEAAGLNAIITSPLNSTYDVEGKFFAQTPREVGNEENFLYGAAVFGCRYSVVNELFNQQLTRCGQF